MSDEAESGGLFPEVAAGLSVAWDDERLRG